MAAGFMHPGNTVFNLMQKIFPTSLYAKMIIFLIKHLPVELKENKQLQKIDLKLIVP